jgi:CheY-like chemotaxis protein
MAGDKKLSILCVDDEKDIVDSLFDTFMDDYDVKTACSGEEALKIFDKEEIAVIITDQRMPEMEGTELLALVHEKKPYCKKILLTGYADINAAVDAINKGSVDKYFSKPWDDEELTEAVKHLISMYDFDKFLGKIKEDGADLKNRARAGTSFDAFFRNYPMGICIPGDDDKIEYINKKGLEILQSDNADNINGNDFRKIFLVDSSKESELRKRFLKNDISPDRIEVKLVDGSQAGMLASLIFDKDRVCGIIFNKPSNVF